MNDDISIEDSTRRSRNYHYFFILSLGMIFQSSLGNLNLRAILSILSTSKLVARGIPVHNLSIPKIANYLIHFT